MYLKRLESVGFKSFAKRIDISFVPGVTAIVGPNGSGKSNITDAIRWVLGEQSVKSLRGEKMEDVIFQGSDTRNPLNFAEVTLVLDNSSLTLPLDYEEVSITRRVYRSGASEFYMNKQSCRLRDIIDLFMDSGLGQDSFSIISQGRVEEVLSSKADDRRIIFEEAAGVLKYKHRKRKAEFKLIETRENLNRIDDILHEIQKQIDPLKEQSEIAIAYKKRSKQLEEHEVSLLITEIETLHKEWQSLLVELDEEKMTEIGLKTTIQQKEAELELKRSNLRKTDEQIEVIQVELLAATQQVEQFEGKRQVFNERIKHFANDKKRLEEQKEKTKNQLDVLRQSLIIEEKNYENLHLEKKSTQDKIKELMKKLTTDYDEIHLNIEELKAKYIEMLNEQAANRSEKKSIAQQLEQLNHRNGMRIEKTKHLSAEREGLEEKKESIREKLTNQKQTFAEKKTEIQILKENLVEQRSHFDIVQNKLVGAYQTVTKLTSRKEMLEEMKMDYQGFYHGVKAVLQAGKQGKLHNIYGAVLECIDVPKSYVTAIETALGGQAQHIVVKNDQDAREAITWLKRSGQGRATFLPLSTIQSRLIAPSSVQKVEGHKGYVGIASELVSTQSKYEIIAQYLMGNILVSRTLKDANELARLTAHRYRIVTLQGDVVNPGGSMSGGSRKQIKQSLFTRDKDLEELTIKQDKSKQSATLLEQELTKQKQVIEQLEINIDEKEQKLTKRQQELQNIHVSHSEIEAELVALNDTLTFYVQDELQFKEEKRKLEKNKIYLGGALTSIEEQLVALQNKINNLTTDEVGLKEKETQIQRELHQCQIILAEQEERARNQYEKMMLKKERFQEIDKQYIAYSDELAELIHSQDSGIVIEKLEKEVLEKNISIEHLTKQVQKQREVRLSETQALQDRELELKEENKKHHLLIQMIQKQEVKVTRLDVELENRLKTLQVDYTITFEGATQKYKKTSNVEETKNKVSQLKKSIKGLGNVNLGAIEEHKRISDRFEFLTEQKTDLMDAKQTLYSIIDEMDAVMKERFETTFTKIKKEFTIVFKELFGGGFASLSLTDENSILDTGIEIIAQPPGKKLQNIGLLSGGERALTAISLLFSILRVRPVPFCVLDEVEAALDEANVVRFAKYVKLHSDHTQFIVITHRKGTMEEADVLYGVTMQESGVSRLVSVQLKDAGTLVNS